MSLSIEVVTSHSISPSTLREVVELLHASVPGGLRGCVRVAWPWRPRIGRSEGCVVSHAMWVTRALQPGRRRPLRTRLHRGGRDTPDLSTPWFREPGAHTSRARDSDYQLGALSPSDDTFYERLGWERWRGPLFIRADARRYPTPEEIVMILRLDNTPADLDLNEPLSAEWRTGEILVSQQRREIAPGRRSAERRSSKPSCRRRADAAPRYRTRRWPGSRYLLPSPLARRCVARQSWPVTSDG